MKAVAEKFEQMGIRAEIYSPTENNTSQLHFRRQAGPVMRIDIKQDRMGRFFDICTDLPLQVLDVDPADRHLVLMAREPDGKKPKYLCGFDERGWFVAALPEPRDIRSVERRRGISDVASAKESLKPTEVIDEERRKGVKRRKRNKRVNKAAARQGEWFFIPTDLFVPKELILRNEPIRMGRRREHLCSELYREGGETVYVNHANPNGLSKDKYDALPPLDRAKGHFSRMVRDANVYARGRVTAPDHAALGLGCWHKVVPNTESSATHGARLTFLD